MGTPEHPTENPYVEALASDWLAEHRFHSLTDLVVELMSILEHDEDPYTGEIIFSTNHKQVFEGWAAMEPMTEADHHLPPGTYTTIEVVEEEQSNG